MDDFKSAVFSGGGGRCLWQVGFWQNVSQEMKLKPDIVAGVSAGAAMAVMVLAGAAETGLSIIKEATAANRKNFYLKNFLTREPVFPQYTIYRNTILKTLDAGALRRFKNGPELRVLIANPPFYLGARSGTAVGLLAYVIEKYTMHPVHPKIASKLGFRATVVKLNDCGSAEEIADLIMCSSCTPPFIPIMKYNGRVSLDGGIIDNVPVSALGEDEKKGRTLILMSRLHKPERIPRIKGRLYMQPSVTPGISKWDYTDPAGLQAAYDLGRRDGDTFIKQYREGMFKE